MKVISDVGGFKRKKINTFIYNSVVVIHREHRTISTGVLRTTGHRVSGQTKTAKKSIRFAQKISKTASTDYKYIPARVFTEPLAS